MHAWFCLFCTFRLTWWKKLPRYFQFKISNSWSEMCGRKTKGSRWQESCPGKGEVVLKWHFLVGRWILGMELEDVCFCIPLFIRLSSTCTFWAYLDFQDTSFSCREHRELRNFVTQWFSIYQINEQKAGVCLMTIMCVKKL